MTTSERIKQLFHVVIDALDQIEEELQEKEKPSLDATREGMIDKGATT